MKWLSKWGWLAAYAVLMTGAVLVIVRGESAPAEPNPPDKITLSFRHFWVKEHDRSLLEIFEQTVESFQMSHPNIKISVEGIDQTTHREQRLKGEMVTGTPPDMFVLFGGAEIEPYVRSNRLADLTGFLRENGLEHQFKDLQLWTFGGHVYGLPIEGNAEPLYYNQALFKLLGIAPPQTLAQLDEAIVRLKAAGYIPFALGNEDRWPAGIFAHYLLDRYAGPEPIRGIAAGVQGASFRNDAYQSAYAHLERWIREGAFSPDANALSTEGAVRQFTSGQAAMYLNGNWDINLFGGMGAAENFGEQVGVLPFPALHEGGERSVAGGYTIGIGLSSNLSGAKLEAALDFMKAFYTEEVQNRIVYEGRRIPSMEVAFDPDQTGPVFAQVARMLADSPDSFVPYDNMLSPEVKKAFLNGLGGMLDGTENARQALEETEQASVRYWQLIRSSGMP
ncbi:ABC transporter substrate-binding protein [Paenibacillus glufosinatiresistens]|uniref:ABC transporter substrate-binding protein n=1 Tax=Paenibacillus glufosinatiresistens TaxID=3070657 RepID=UPI00286D71B1|nr:extracellular solute-binding protein [Paenibacillus sp. YX.27]